MGIHLYSAALDPDLEITGGGRVGVGERPVSKKKVFWPFEPQFGLKIRGGGVGWAPLLDLPLFWYNKSYCTWCMWLNLHAQDLVKFCHILQTGLSHSNEAHEGEPMDGNLK